MLVRTFVGRRLAEYYAQPSSKVVGWSAEVEAKSGEGWVSSLLGSWHWRRVFQRIYEEREGHWLTPVELFRPQYSRVLADFCVQSYRGMSRTVSGTRCGGLEREGGGIPASVPNGHTTTQAPAPLEIVELGGGRGTNASLILEYLQLHQPSIYEALSSYTLVDNSPSLHQFQRERFGEGQAHHDKVRCELRDLVDVAEGTTNLLSASEVPTVVLGMEVLDNLPHDKIRGATRHTLEQAEVVEWKDNTETTGHAHSSKPNQQHYRERFVPLSDPLLTHVLRTVPSFYTQASENARWVPSIACGVLDHVIRQRPNLGLVLADFDWLPPPDLDAEASAAITYETLAEGSPIVTDMDGRDHPSYLAAPHCCDILFPTDFARLTQFVQRRLPREARRVVVRAEKQSAFLERWGPTHVDQTKSWLTGHTPLLHDFVNCSVLTLSPKQ